jgi:hypothetical protein
MKLVILNILSEGKAMAKINIDNIEFANWRIPYTLSNVFEEELESYIIGKLLRLANTIKNSVVFLYDVSKVDRTSKSDLNLECDVKIIRDEYLEEFANSKCVQMWEERGKTPCDEQNKKAFKILFNHYFKGLPLDNESNCLMLFDKSFDGSARFTYRCGISKDNLEEWIVPVFVKGRFCGAFVTGQFSHIGDDIKPKPSAEALGKFLELAKSLQNTIDKMYDEKSIIHERELIKVLNDIVWCKVSRYGDSLPKIKSENASSLTDIVNRIKATRSHLFDCVIILREMFGLNDFILYKPISDLEEMENEASIHISGANLGRGIPKAGIKKVGDNNDYDRDFTRSKHQLLNNQIEFSNDSGQLLSEIRIGVNCSEWLNENAYLDLPTDLSNHTLVAYAVQGYPNYPVGYLFNFGNVKSSDQAETEKKKEKLLEILERVTSIFLTQWLMNYSAYYKHLYKEQSENILRTTKILRHELGQSNIGFLLNLSSFEDNIWECPDDEVTPRIKNIIKNAKSFAYTTMLQTNISKYISGSLEPKKEFFFPYGRFLYKWKEVYYENMGTLGLCFRLKHFDKDDKDDKNHPFMYADPYMIEQVAYNLTNNAMKYALL